MIGNQWAESGAGKRQHDKDVAEERRVLAEAAIKEKADQDREIVRAFVVLWLTDGFRDRGRGPWWWLQTVLAMSAHRSRRAGLHLRLSW